MASNNSSRRRILFRCDPHCFWCGKLTVLSDTTRLKHDTATVDHLYSRLHPERQRGQRSRTVLACNQCNAARCHAESRGLMFVPKLSARGPIAELTTATPLGAPVYKSGSQQPHRAVLNPPKSGYGWFDNEGVLRPRDWDEYCKYFREKNAPSAIAIARRHPAAVRTLKEEFAEEIRRAPMRVICTLKEAVEFARENPSR